MLRVRPSTNEFWGITVRSIASCWPSTYQVYSSLWELYLLLPLLGTCSPVSPVASSLISFRLRVPFPQDQILNNDFILLLPVSPNLCFSPNVMLAYYTPHLFLYLFPVYLCWYISSMRADTVCCASAMPQCLEQWQAHGGHLARMY